MRVRWRPEWTTLLGTMPDNILSRQIGISKTALGRRRRELGLPVFSSPRVLQCGWCGKDVTRAYDHSGISCDECKRVNRSATAKTYRRKTLARHRAQMRIWRAANKERIKQKHAAWLAANPDRVAKIRERSNTRVRLQRARAKERAIAERVEAEVRAERNRLGMEHYGWARNAE